VIEPYDEAAVKAWLAEPGAGWAFVLVGTHAEQREVMRRMDPPARGDRAVRVLTASARGADAIGIRAERAWWTVLWHDGPMSRHEVEDEVRQRLKLGRLPPTTRVTS
jgi:hypothetical protein